jgi:trans-aconitate methyltransferase
MNVSYSGSSSEGRKELEMSEPTQAQAPVSEKRWDPTLYDSKHSFVWKYGQELIELLAPQPGERILDLGCGTGHLTSQLALAGSSVTGLDHSPAMIQQARLNYPNLAFVEGNAADFAFAEPFDGIFSNAALHWVKRAEDVVVCVASALKPGGRFVAEFGGKGNIRAIHVALLHALEELGNALRLAKHSEWNPWYYPTIGEYASLLERHGLAVRHAVLFDRPTPLEEGERGLRIWLQMFAEDLLDALSPEAREQTIQSVERQLRPSRFRDGSWIADYARIRVLARREP